MNKLTLGLAVAMACSVAPAQNQFQFIEGKFEPFSVNYTRTMSGRNYTLNHTDFGKFTNVFNTGQDIYLSFTNGLDLDTSKPTTGFTGRWLWRADNGLYASLNGSILFQDGQKMDATASVSVGVQIRF